ncbi:MAG TPA: flagellar motor protein MotA, partial [Alphaproteobacteria bacterium]|nr:flagellar motor protein MotA [Alphaproteobacteria bacterium]
IGGNLLTRLQSYFRWLEVIGNVAPLLGLLGTVIGMIGAFQALEEA